MKCKLDLCRIQWINRELLPHYSLFKWNKNESRFARIFSAQERSESHQSIITPANISASSSNSTSSSVKSNTKKESNSIIQLFKASPHEHQKNPNLPPKTSEINIIKILTQEDKRTTLMIKNIPNKFTKDNFLDIFNLKFSGKFDLFLLPTDIKERKNYGYAFINFINYFYIIYFYHLFNGKKWANTNSIKICEIVYSKIQGITKMVKHYPIKVMYQKEIKDKSSEFSEKEREEKKESGNSLSIAIPMIYKKEFDKIYPKVDIEFDLNEDVFYIEPEKLIMHSND